jgi:hypothetical protein
VVEDVAYYTRENFFFFVQGHDIRFAKTKAISEHHKQTFERGAAFVTAEPYISNAALL